jgi:hypothetical protein
MGIEPVPIKFYGDPNSEKRFKKTVINLEFNLNRKKLILMAIKRKICTTTMESLT